MQLSDKDIEKFQQLYRDRYNKEISKEEALDQALKLISLLRRIMVPMSKERFNEIQEYRRSILPDVIHRIAHSEDEPLH